MVAFELYTYLLLQSMYCAVSDQQACLYHVQVCPGRCECILPVLWSDSVWVMVERPTEGDIEAGVNVFRLRSF